MKKNCIKTILNEISDVIEQGELTHFEHGNLLHDLVDVKARIQAGHYKQSDYISRNTYDIPRRTEEFLIYLDGYHQVGQIWKKILESFIDENTSSVLDLCPGWAPKIEMALYHLDFAGTVYVWDVDTTSTRRVKQYMQLFKSSFTIEEINSDILESNKKTQSNLIVANHIIDDLLLYSYCKEAELNLHDLYGSESAMLEAVAVILQKPKVANKIVNVLVSLIQKNLLGGGSVVMSQYPGLFERANEIDDWVLFCKQTMLEIKEELLKMNFEDKTEVITAAFSDPTSTYFSKNDIVCLQKR